MISLTKISQIQNLDSVYNLINPSPNIWLLFYVYFYVTSGASGNNLTTTCSKHFVC